MNSAKQFALITGATSGIGRAIARELAGRGYNLVLASRNTEKMKELAKELKSRAPENASPLDVRIYKSDLSRPEAADKLLDRLEKDLSANKEGISILINNAGIGLPPGPQYSQEKEEADRLFYLNCRTLYRLSTRIGKSMAEAGEGRILNIASTAAFQPMPYAALYGASKAFVLSLSEAMAMELKRKGVTVTASCPGITDTNFFRFGKPSVPQWLYPLISPEQVARRSLRAMFRGKVTVVPNFQHWLIGQIPRILPRGAMARFMQCIEHKRKNMD